MTAKGTKLGRPQRFHGLSGTPEFDVFRAMVRRCKNDAEYAGVSVDPTWIEDPRLFVAHVGPRPSPKHQIDRINSSGNYEPGNVRWVTVREQVRNRRNTVWVEHPDGRRMCLADWARLLRLDWQTLWHRLHNLGQPPEVALVSEKLNAGRPKKTLTHNGVTLHLSAWAEKLGLNPSTLTQRMKRGLSTEQVLAPAGGY